MAADHLVTVAVFATRGDAEITRALLLDAGIEALVQADDEGGLNPGFYRDYGVRLVVTAEDAVAARDVLEGTA